MNLDFNLNYSFGDDLKEIPDDQGQFDQAIEYLKEQLEKESSQLELTKVHSKLGSLLRIRGRLDESLNHHLMAEKILDGLSEPRLAVLNKIRLASTFQFLKSYDQATEILKACINSIEGSPESSDIIDFAFQHLGKVYFDQREVEKAEVAFLKALEIRKVKGDQELVASTTQALNAIQKSD